MKKTGVWSILIMYFFMICLTYIFPYLLYEIKCIWCCLCRKALKFILPIWYLNPCAFNHLYTIKDLAPSVVAQKIQHKSDAFLDTVHVITTIHCSQSSNIYIRRKSSRGTNKPWQHECIFLMLDEVWLGTWPNCFSIGNSNGFGCQITFKLNPMKQKMHHCFQSM